MLFLDVITHAYETHGHGKHLKQDQLPQVCTLIVANIISIDWRRTTAPGDYTIIEMANGDRHEVAEDDEILRKRLSHPGPHAVLPNGTMPRLTEPTG